MYNLTKERLTCFVLPDMPVIKLASDVINSLTGGGSASLVDILEEVIGNNTLIEQALSHWNATGTATATKMKKSTLLGISSPRALNLLKLGMRMTTGKF